MSTPDRLYEVTFDGLDDYVPDAGLDRIAELVARLPQDFTLEHVQASASGTTQATMKFPPGGDLFGRHGQVADLLEAAMWTRSLLANLVAARAALAERSSE